MQPRIRAAAIAAVIGVVLSTVGLSEPAAAAESGSIAGAVTADRGEVRALRVKARDTDRKVIYTVFTTGGHYTIYNLPAGTYEVQVLEIGFDSPTETVTVAAGQAATADLALTANGVTAPRGEGGARAAYGAEQQGERGRDHARGVRRSISARPGPRHLDEGLLRLPRSGREDRPDRVSQARPKERSRLAAGHQPDVRSGSGRLAGR